MADHVFNKKATQYWLSSLILLSPSSDSPTTVSPFDFGSILTKTNTQQN